MNDIETFDGSVEISPIDELYKKQQEDVSMMRASLLGCADNSDRSRQALQNISVLRVYHQVSRIIRYLDMMDKLEDKIYQAMDYTLANADVTDDATLGRLLILQQQLQKTMIESQKLLAPYVELNQYTDVPIVAKQENPLKLVMDSDQRENLRNAAKLILDEIEEND